jgi:hypothetical protein
MAQLDVYKAEGCYLIMKLIDAINKEKGVPFEIPNCSRNDLPGFFKQIGYKVGAEIGVFQGEFTEKFCQSGLGMYAIDPWVGYAGAGRTEKVQTKQDTNFEHAKTRLSPFDNCTIVRKSSMEAINDFKDNSLDFVYIDGDHRFRYFAEDIYEWYKKIRPGGAISGHDYFMTKPSHTNVICQVEPIVDAFVKAYRIEDFYTFGTGDRTLSWLFIKP